MKTGTKDCPATGLGRIKAPGKKAGSHHGNPAVLKKHTASRFSAFKESQDLLRTRLTGPLVKLMFQLTGVRLHVLWHQPLDFSETSPVIIPCPKAHQAIGSSGQWHEHCESCCQQRWKPALSRANHGRRFDGECGTANFCACLCVNNHHPLTLILQTRLTTSTASFRSSGQSSDMSSQAQTPVETAAVAPAGWRNAVALTRLIAHDLETTARAQITSTGLEKTLLKLQCCQNEIERLHGQLRRLLPGPAKATGSSAPPIRPPRLAQAMTDYVRLHYQQPISLNVLAAVMKMNASYLSTRFRQVTGVTFHEFLQAVRLSKAKELLGDPRNRIGEVADAIGYASPDAFRHAFKAHEGRSPEAWRAEP